MNAMTDGPYEGDMVLMDADTDRADFQMAGVVGATNADGEVITVRTVQKPRVCPQCGASGGVEYHTEPLGDRLKWVTGASCSRCGHQWTPRPEPSRTQVLADVPPIRELLAGYATLTVLSWLAFLAWGMWYVAVHDLPPSDDLAALTLRDPLAAYTGAVMTAMTNPWAVVGGLVLAYITGRVVTDLWDRHIRPI